jgi:pSer/pThr/pTyr-binding forkhead associated (FHA) protein
MPERSSLKPAPASLPTLSPQGTQAGKPAMPLGRPFTLVGSRNRAHLHLLSSTVSRNHACIIVTDNGLYIRDLASRSGVIVNGRRVKEADLRDGDTIQIGSFKFKFGDPAGPVRFPLTPKAAAAVLDIEGGGQTHVDGRTLLIGRRPTADIPVNDASISNTHALIFEVNGQRFVRDLGSRTGTLVNGKPVHHQLLEFGDEIKIGGVMFRFLAPEGEAQPQLDEGLPGEPQLDEDEPIGIDFSASEAGVQASKNGELAPIPIDDTEEAPLRLVAPTESTDEIPLEIDEAPQATAGTAAVAGASDAEHGLTIPPAVVTPAADLGLAFLAEEPTHAPTPASRPVEQQHASVDPAVGVEATTSAQTHEPCSEAIEIAQSAEAMPPAEELEVAQPALEPVETEPLSASQLTAADQDTLATESEPITMPAPEAASVVTAAEPIEIEPSVDYVAAPEAPPKEYQPVEPAIDSAPARATEPVIEDDIGLSPVAPIAEEPIEPEPIQPSLAEVEPVSDHADVRAEQPTSTEESAPVLQKVDLSSMRFDEPAAAELAPESVEAEPQAPEPLLDLPPETDEGATDAEMPAAETLSAPEGSAPGTPVVVPESPAVTPELSAAPGIPIAAAGAVAAAAAVPLAETVIPAATAAVELASPTLEPPPAKPKRRGRAPRGKAAEVAPPAVVDPVPPEAPGAEATPAPKRRRGSRKKPAADLAPESPEDARAAQPATDSSTSTTPADATLTEPSTQADAFAAMTEPAIVPEDVPVDPAAQAPVAEEVFAPVHTSEAAVSSEEPRAVTSQIAAQAAANTLETEQGARTEPELETEVLAQPFFEPPEVDGETVRLEPLSGTEATAPTATNFTSEWSQSATAESEGGRESFCIGEVLEDEPVELEQAPLPAATAPIVENADVLDSTDPTPESALAIEPALEQVDVSEPQAQTLELDSALTDTAFGQVVQEFSGGETGSLVEDTFASKESADGSGEADQAEAGVPALTKKEEPGAEDPVHADAEPVSPIDFESAPEDNFDFDVPEPDLAIDLSDTPAERAIGGGQDSGIPSRPAAGLRFPASEPPGALEHSLSSTASLASSRQPIFPSAQSVAAPPPAADGASPPVLRTAEPLPANISVTPPPASPPAMNPFLGMSRDMDSFIGGMPLSLAKSAPPAPHGPPPTTAAPSPAEPQTLSFSNGPDSIPPLDLSVPEQPLELFDQTPERLDAIPDSLGPISSVDGTVVPEVRAAPPATSRPSAPPQAPLAVPPQVQRAAPSNPMRQVAPPPPPRTSPLRSFTSGPQGNVPPPAFPGNISVTPPFGGAAPPPQRLTGSATREVDVFSNTAFPPLDPSMFGIAKRPSPPAQTPVRKQPDPPTEAELAVLARAPRPQPILPNRQPVAKPAAHEQPRRPWWKSLRILLPLMILAILVVIVIVVFFPPRHTVQGSLQLQGLNRDDGGVVRQTVGSLRNLVPAAAKLAAATLKQQNMEAGFLADPEAISTMTQADNSPFDEARSQLEFHVPTRNVESDRPRMAALLSALYAESGRANDDAARARGQVQQAEAHLTDLQTRRQLQDGRVTKLSDQLSASAGPLAQPILANPRASLTEIEQEDQQLRTAMDTAAAQVQRQREAFRLAQARAAQSDTQAAAELANMRQSIDDLTARLDAVRLAQSGQIDEASKKFSKALDDFSGQLAAVQGDAGDPKVAAYMSAARDAGDQIRRQSDQLTARAKHDAQSVEQLRREIADRRETHLRQVWAGDSTLGQLVEQRDAASHQYNVAVDSGMAEEASKKKGVLEDLDKKIDARRSALATGGQYADDLQQQLAAAIERMESDRQRDEQQLLDKLKLLAAPADVPALAKLSQTASALISTRQAYASAAALSATEADSEARRLQGRIAEQQARLDTLRQNASSQSSLDAAQSALDTAQAAEAKASAAYTSNQATLSTLRQLADAKADAADLADRVRQKQAEIEQLRRDVAASPIVVKPDDAAVSVLYAPDTRVQYMVAGVVVVLLLFAGPLWMSFVSPEPRIPMAHAVVESYEVPGHETEEYLPENFDEEHPATV